MNGDENPLPPPPLYAPPPPTSSSASTTLSSDGTDVPEEVYGVMPQGDRGVLLDDRQRSRSEQQAPPDGDSNIGPYDRYANTSIVTTEAHPMPSGQHASSTTSAAADSPGSSTIPPLPPPAPRLSGPIPGMPRSGRFPTASPEAEEFHRLPAGVGLRSEPDPGAHFTITHPLSPGSTMDSVGAEDDPAPQLQAVTGALSQLEAPAQLSVDNAAPTPPTRVNESEPLTTGDAMQHPWDSQSQGDAAQESHVGTDDVAASMRSASATPSVEEPANTPPSESPWARWSKKASSLIKDTLTDPSSRFSLAGMGLAAGAAYLAYGDGFIYSGIQGSTGSRILANTLSALSLAGVEGYRVVSAIPPASTTDSDTDTSADTNKSDKSWSGTYRRCKKSISDLITGISDPKRSVQRLGKATFKLEDAAPALTKYAGLCAGSVSPTGVFLASAGEFGANAVMRQLRAND